MKDIDEIYDYIRFLKTEQNLSVSLHPGEYDAVICATDNGNEHLRDTVVIRTENPVAVIHKSEILHRHAKGVNKEICNNDKEIFIGENDLKLGLKGDILFFQKCFFFLFSKHFSHSFRRR